MTDNFDFTRESTLAFLAKNPGSSFTEIEQAVGGNGILSAVLCNLSRSSLIVCSRGKIKLWRVNELLIKE